MMNRIATRIALAAFSCLGAEPVRAQSPEAFLNRVEEARTIGTATKYELEIETIEYARINNETKKPIIPKDIQFQTLLTAIVDPNNGDYKFDNRGYVWNAARQQLDRANGLAVFRNGVLRTVRYLNDGLSGVGENGRSADSTIIRDRFDMNPFHRYSFPILFELGFVPILTNDTLYAGQFQNYRSKDFADCLTPIASSVPGTTSFTTPPSKNPLGQDHQEFVVSSTEPYNILIMQRFRTTLTKQKQLAFKLEIRYGADRKRPTGWTYTNCYLGVPQTRMTVVIKSRQDNLELTDADFTLKPESGTIVLDVPKNYNPSLQAESNPGIELRYYSVSPNGELVPIGKSEPYSRYPMIRCIVSSIIVAIIVVLASLTLRRILLRPTRETQ